jgi:nuclear pore complex protein Nup160
MDSGESQYLFKETRLNLEPSSPSVIINIQVPRLANQGRSANRRAVNGDSNATEEEIEFRRKNLATASSISHRLWHDSPRSFLWRVIEDGTILSVRAVDVCKQERESDAPLILNFHFSVPIIPSCIALADPKDHDALCIFVLDETYHLHYISLRPDAFRKRSTMETGFSEICKSYLPPVFGFKHPHRMVAVSADQLVVMLTDGGLVRLDRNKAHDGKSPRISITGMGSNPICKS